MTVDYSTFQPDRFSRLRLRLSSLSYASSVSQLEAKALYAELEQARPWFLQLLDVPPQNKADKDAVEKGESAVSLPRVAAARGPRAVLAHGQLSPC